MTFPLGLLCVPAGLQGLVMVVDEFYYHHQRDLPLWERWGHPLDTLLFWLTLFWTWRMPPSEGHWAVFLILAALSTLTITKDEWVHARNCTPGEHWLHALLFVLHPLALVSAGMQWQPSFVNSPAHGMLTLQLILIFLFMIYQIGYWNLFRPAYSPQRPSHTKDRFPQAKS